MYVRRQTTDDCIVVTGPCIIKVMAVQGSAVSIGIAANAEKSRVLAFGALNDDQVESISDLLDSARDDDDRSRTIEAVHRTMT